ncbi:hypothetical protein MMIC_P0656 [Mariprofundus micogutta]|uniref:Outer-membrane lipoprotein LolB n=2 Tax=Mariprofundus micogutta TaxID=1921010 RepID=A0A1L8CLC1_9PROT|nr:hypothetical protein MMIC_P0656 [Mariprofundus micogutta]
MRRLYAPALLLLLGLLVAGCAKKIDTETATGIGPYPEFSGRLIVIEPKRRWQVSVNWQSSSPEKGWLRLTHAVSGTVVDFRWSHDFMEVRDNNNGYWKNISQQQLGKQGIVLPPQQLASVLLDEMPSHFKKKNGNTWESTASGSLIRLEWKAEKQQLIMTDMLHGRRATLIIQPS